MKKLISIKRKIPDITIQGKSLINHHIRQKLKLSCDEYVLLEYLYTRQIRKPDDRITYGSLYYNIAMNEYDLTVLWPGLKEKGFVYKDPISKMIVITHKWAVEFEVNLEEFDLLWKTYGRIDGKLIGKPGNKFAAQQVYKKALKVASFETILEGAIAYTKNCNESKVFIKNLSTWLNPQFKYWEDELPEIKSKETSKPIINEVTNFMDGAKK